MVARGFQLEGFEREPLIAPFPYFGGKREEAESIWHKFGKVKQYIEPFCGSAAVLLAAPEIVSLEVVCDASGFIANFWRAVKHQPEEAARWADYPISHIDMGARHVWLMEQRERLGTELQDPDWPGDAKVAGWWLWGQCARIGGGWCDWQGPVPRSDSGVGIQAKGPVPHCYSAGQGIQAKGSVPNTGNAGIGILARGKSAGRSDGMLTSAGSTALVWLRQLSERLERVRIVHGHWFRALNNNYGGLSTAVFLDPPYRKYEELYGVKEPVADEVADWARAHPELKIAICGHVGDYELPGWEAVQWSRGRFTFGGNKTTDAECIWYSPACAS